MKKLIKFTVVIVLVVVAVKVVTSIAKNLNFDDMLFGEIDDVEID